MHKLIAAIILLIISITGANAMNADFYVSPRGSDAWSGTLPAPNPMNTDGPFATIARAQKAARDAKGACTVILREGTYSLDAPLAFGPEDSDTTYAAYPGEKPVISGGKRITGWKDDGNGLWTTNVAIITNSQVPSSNSRSGSSPSTINHQPSTIPYPPSTINHQPSAIPYPRDLYVNGERRSRPRLPKEGFYRLHESLGDDVRNAFRYAEGDVKPWRNLDDVEVIAFNAWDELRFHVASINEKDRIITFTGSNNWPWGKWGQTSQRYYAENVLEGFDQPGQWYLDRKSGVLSYRPMPGEDMRRVEVIVPSVNELLSVKGEKDRPVERLNFHGISFRYAGWDLARESYISVQAAVKIPGAIRMDGVKDCGIRDCEFSRIGQYAIELSSSQGTEIKGNTIHDIGAGGVKLHSGEGNLITRNHIYDLGHTFFSAVGVWLGNSGHNTISYNHIHDLYYTGISVGWSWGYAPTLTKNNIIEHNHIHHLGKGLLSDMGGIYTLGLSEGSVIRYNLIHDVQAFSYGGWGIYLDEGTTGMLVENNIVYRTKTGGFHQHYGKENIIRNNIFAYAKEGQIQRTRDEGHISFTFEHNIVYWSEGPLFHGNWNNADHYRIDHNIYWSDKEANWFSAYGGQDFQKWRTDTRDAHSVLCDPLFVDPQHDDFRLAPDSQVEKLGFKPIVGAGD